MSRIGSEKTGFLGRVLLALILMGVLPAWAATPVKVGYSFISGASAIPWIAVDKGLFAKYDLDVEMQYIAGGSLAVQALLGGTIHVLQTGIEPVINSNAQGADTVMVGSIVNTVVFSLVVRPEIKEVKDLKGMPMGVSRFGASTDFVLRYALKKWGFKPDVDVPVIQIGEESLIPAAMEAKKIYGGTVSEPHLTKARQAGFRALVDLSEVIPGFLSSGIVVRRSYVKANEEVMRGFLKAITEAIAVFMNDPDTAKRVMRERLKIQDAEVLENTYKGYTRYISRVIYPSRPGIALAKEALEEKNPAIRKLSIEELIDNRFVGEMEQSGFIDSLYRSR